MGGGVVVGGCCGGGGWGGVLCGGVGVGCEEETSRGNIGLWDYKCILRRQAVQSVPRGCE